MVIFGQALNIPPSSLVPVVTTTPRPSPRVWTAACPAPRGTTARRRGSQPCQGNATLLTPCACGAVGVCVGVCVCVERITQNVVKSHLETCQYSIEELKRLTWSQYTPEETRNFQCKVCTHTHTHTHTHTLTPNQDSNYTHNTHT